MCSSTDLCTCAQLTCDNDVSIGYGDGHSVAEINVSANAVGQIKYRN